MILYIFNFIHLFTYLLFKKTDFNELNNLVAIVILFMLTFTLPMLSNIAPKYFKFSVHFVEVRES